MATGRVPTTANSPLTAKGDLFTYSTAPARLAVGNDGEQIVADSSTSTGLRYTAGTVQANPVLNSAAQIWQRGTSVTGSTTAFCADRWQAYRNTTGSTFSRVTTGDTTNLPNIQYAIRAQRNSGDTATNDLNITQNIETANSIPFAGKTVTVSFYARKGANFSAASSQIYLQVFTGTGTDQNLYTGYTGQVTANNTTSTLTTTWQRFSTTFSIGATATEISIVFAYACVGTAGAADYFDLTGVQMDIGSVPLPFRTYAGTIQGELAACQRYFELCGFGSNVSVPAQAISTTASYGSFFYKVTKRGTPTIATSGGTFKVWNATATDVSATFQADSISVDGARIAAVSASGLVAGNAAALSFQNVTMTISAEL
jgi:hypothetical protein